MVLDASPLEEPAIGTAGTRSGVMKPPQRVLVVQTAFIGDVVLAEPLVRATRASAPGARIDFMLIPAAANLLETHPDIEELHIYDKRGKDRGIRGFYRILQRLRMRRYDLALIPHRSLRSAALAALAGIPWRIGFDTSAGRRLLTHVRPYEETHEVERNLSLLSPLVGEAAYDRPQLYPDAEDVAVAEKLTDGRQGRAFAIAPGSVWATKRWPESAFVALGRKFTERDACTIFVLGGAADHALCARVADALGSTAVNLAGRLTLRQSVALLGKCDVLVSNDSAPTHLGVAAGCAVVTIFGSTVPAFGFAPSGEQHRIVESPEQMDCRPCGRHGRERCPLGTLACMTTITPAHVEAAVMYVLENAELPRQ